MISSGKLINVIFIISFIAHTGQLFGKTDESALVKAEIMHCNDGDTCRLKINPESNNYLWLNVRLAGIDAPETSKKRKKSSGQPFAEDAKRFINDQLAKQIIMIKQVDLDHFNRPIVEMYLKEKLFNLLLLEKGLAEVYRGKTKRIDRKLYEASELAAKKAKIGIWSLKDYVSPQEFRKSN